MERLVNGIVLSRDHVGVLAAESQQRLMRAFFEDLSVVDDNNLVGIFDGGKTMSDHESGAIFQQRFHRLLNQLFAFCVQIAGGFVEDQDFWIRQ